LDLRYRIPISVLLQRRNAHQPAHRLYVLALAADKHDILVLVISVFFLRSCVPGVQLVLREVRLVLELELTVGQIVGVADSVGTVANLCVELRL